MPTIDFSNTQIAFEYKTNKELQQAYKLFKLLSYPALVNAGAVLSPLLVNCGGKFLIKKTLYKQFVGGETREECSSILNTLAKYNIGSILDYSVEGEQNEDGSDRLSDQVNEQSHT